jgi:hypothetical protein
MMPNPAAERRQSVATAGGRGNDSGLDEPRSGDRIFRRYAACTGCRLVDHGLQPWLLSIAATRLAETQGDL